MKWIALFLFPLCSFAQCQSPATYIAVIAANNTLKISWAYTNADFYYVRYKANNYTNYTYSVTTLNTIIVNISYWNYRRYGFEVKVYADCDAWKYRCCN